MIAQFLLFAAIGTSTPGQCILLPEWVYPTNGVPTLLGENIPGLPSNRFHKIDRDAALSYFSAIDGYYERKMRPYTAEQIYVGEIIGQTNPRWPWYAISPNFLADVTNDANRVYTNYWRRIDNRLRLKALELANDWKGKALGRPEVLYYGSSRFLTECLDWITYDELTLSNAVVAATYAATNGLWLGINDAKWFGETFDRGHGYNSPLWINGAVRNIAYLPSPTSISNRAQTSWAMLARRAGGRVFANAVTETNLTRRVTADDIAFATEVQAVVDKTYHGTDVGYGFRPDRVERRGGSGYVGVFTCEDASVEEIVPLYDSESNFTGTAEVILNIGELRRYEDFGNMEVVSNRTSYSNFEPGNQYPFGAGVDFGDLSGEGVAAFSALFSVGDPESAISVFSELEEDIRYPVSFILDESGVSMYIWDDNKGLAYDEYIWIKTPYDKIPDVLPVEYYELASFLVIISCDNDCTLWRSEDTGITLDIARGGDITRRGDIPFLVPHRSQLGNVASVSVQWALESFLSWVNDGIGDEYYSAGGFHISAPDGGFMPDSYNSLVGGQMRDILKQKLDEAKFRVLHESGAAGFDDPIAALRGHLLKIANSWKSRLNGKKCLCHVGNYSLDDIEVIVHDGKPTFFFAGTNDEVPRDLFFGTVVNYINTIGVTMNVNEEGHNYEILITPSINPIIYWKFSNLPCSD